MFFPMSFPSTSTIAALALVLLTGCAGDPDLAPMQTCRAVDGRGNVYEATELEMLVAMEDALQQCETAATDPATCVASGCRGAR